MVLVLGVTVDVRLLSRGLFISCFSGFFNTLTMCTQLRLRRASHFSEHVRVEYVLYLSCCDLVFGFWFWLTLPLCRAQALKKYILAKIPGIGKFFKSDN